MSNNYTGKELLLMEEVKNKYFLHSTFVTMCILEKGGVPVTRMFRINDDMEHPVELPLSEEFEPWRVDDVMSMGDPNEGEFGVYIRKSDPNEHEQYFWFFPEDSIAYNVKFTVCTGTLYIENSLKVEITSRREKDSMVISTVKQIDPFYPKPILFGFNLSDTRKPIVDICGLKLEDSKVIGIGEKLYHWEIED